MKTSRLGYFEAVWLACSAFPLVARPAEPPAPRGAVEPDYRTATQWWSELRKKWTPLGWKNHLFRYNVLFNGAVVAEPNMNRRTARWAGQGVLVWPSSANPADDGTIRQGWSRDHDAPVLWTDWSGPTDANAKASRVSLRQQVFAHIPGAAFVASIAYGAYLVQKLVIHGAAEFCRVHDIDPKSAPALVGVELSVYAAATTLFFTVERPFLQLRHHVAPRASRAPSSLENDR